ncbi:tRNA-guanine(15) transglycosylase-like protein [Trametes punicea]|nr:tRNA-guanine(15) transglycosylase-like protein [Trametes punicea]
MSMRAESTMATRPSLFVTAAPPPQFGPRTGTLTIAREETGTVHRTETPALLTATSRGIVPHLSRDHVHLTRAIQHVQLPFESFIYRNPPVPTLVDGAHPLHTFLGYSPESHIITMTLRDPSDGRKMPPNGHDFVCAHCTRGVRKVTASHWSTYVHKCKPDIVVALSDTPFTPPPHSQKRLTKSIERSLAWLSSILKVPVQSNQNDSRPRHVLVQLAGGVSCEARAEFADRLTDPVEDRDAAELAPFNTLDEGVAGYVFDLLPLRAALAAKSGKLVDEGDLAGGLVRTSDRHCSSPDSSARLAELLQSSLQPLPQEKPRVLNSPASPHEVLRLMRDVGVDLVDSFWAQRAADMGVALDFRFPAPDDAIGPRLADCSPPRKRKGGKSDLGHNLYDSAYVHDHSRLASSFLDGYTAASLRTTNCPVCECCACSPHAPASRILHSAVDAQAWQDASCGTAPSALLPPSTRAYVHHLLHTHEMSAHALLAMHNLTVFSAFLAGVRTVIGGGQEAFAREVERFEAAYDEDMALWAEAELMWLEVERARGKGRLAREKEKQKESTVGTAVEM